MATLQSGKCFTVPTFFGMCCRSEWQERMYIYKWHEVDQTKHEIFCVHIVCNEIQVKVNFLFLFAFSILSQLFLIWGCTTHSGFQLKGTTFILFQTNYDYRGRLLINNMIIDLFLCGFLHNTVMISKHIYYNAWFVNYYILTFVSHLHHIYGISDVNLLGSSPGTALQMKHKSRKNNPKSCRIKLKWHGSFSKCFFLSHICFC